MLSSKLQLFTIAAMLATVPLLGQVHQSGVEAGKKLTDYAKLLICREVIVTRHADRKEPDDLTEQGLKQAEALRDKLKGRNVTKIVVSDKIRAQKTAKPLKDFLARKAYYIEGITTASDIIDYLSGNVTSNDVILVVSHSDIIPGLLTQFGKTTPVQVTGYGEMFVLHPSVTEGCFYFSKEAYGVNVSKSP